MSHHVSTASNILLAVRLSMIVGFFHVIPSLIPRDLPLRAYFEGRREVVLPLIRETRRQALDGTLIRPYAKSRRRRYQTW